MPGFMEALGFGGAPQAAPAPGFQQAVNPAPQEGPPTTPQELEQRKSGWQQFMHNLQNDPAMKTAAFMAAGQLLRGPDMGETHMGNVGRALQLGTLAHSFMGANRTRQDMEAQRLEETKRVNDSNIEQNAVQTAGMQQDQSFNREKQPLLVQGQRLKNASEEFTVANQPAAFDSQMKTEASKRQLDRDHGDFYRKGGQAKMMNAGAGGPKTAAGVQMLREQVDMLKSIHPQGADEHPLDYEGRINQMALENQKRTGNAEGVRASALRTLMENTDPKSPEYAQYEKQLAAIGAGAPKQEAGTPAAAGNKGFPKEAFDRANDMAKKAGKTTFQGPDGGTYKVK